MTWIEKEAIGETLRDAIPVAALDDDFAALLAILDKVTEADPTPDPK